jgi:hypothetical protein
MVKESNEKINYADLIDLGFRRVECTDNVHLNQYGYPYFYLIYGEDDDIVIMEWSPVDREVNLYLKSQTYRSGISLDEVKEIVRLLTTEV